MQSIFGRVGCIVHVKYCNWSIFLELISEQNGILARKVIISLFLHDYIRVRTVTVCAAKTLLSSSSSFVYHRIISLTQYVGAICSGQWPNFEEASFGWWSM